MSRYLLDTCALLWWMSDDPQLGEGARRAIRRSKNEVFVSVASLWEIAIKRRRGRLQGVDEYLQSFPVFHEEWDFRQLVIEPDDAVRAGSLDIDLQDPFDRMLIAQALRIDARLVTSDRAIRKHYQRCVW